MPRATYERFVRGYTVKQWGTNARELESGLAGRFQKTGNNQNDYLTGKAPYKSCELSVPERRSPFRG
jgi:UDP-galactopyranose mutase